MDSTWTSPWNTYGMHHSMDIPYGFHGWYGMKKWLGHQPKNITYEFHGLGLDSTHSIWTLWGSVKTLNILVFVSHPPGYLYSLSK